MFTIDTKDIKKGIVTIGGMPIKEGMPISDLENILNIEIKQRDKYVGYVLSSELIENGIPIKLVTWFKDDLVEKLELRIGRFNHDDDAHDYLDDWLKGRDVTERVGSDVTNTYYSTEFGALVPALLRDCSDSFCYSIIIAFRYGIIPTRKFVPFKEKENNFLNIIVGDSQYKIQRILPREEDENLPYLGNCLGSGPFGICRQSHSKNDRMEIIYFNISKIDNGTETVIGIAEFTYFAISDAYKNSELFITLDGLTQEWGMIGYAIEKYGCGLEIKKMTPYVLLFERIHDEIPSNKELEKLTKNKNCMKMLLESAIQLTSKYVKVQEEFITIMRVSSKKDNMFTCHKKIGDYEDVYINYQRSEKAVLEK